MHATSLVEQMGAIVAAYVSCNSVTVAELPTLIDSVHTALGHLRTAATSVSSAIRPTPGQIAASIGREYLISFIDGAPYRSLKRHLTTCGLTPELYRERYGLPADYPMISPGYSAVRSRIAKHNQLGLKAP